MTGVVRLSPAKPHHHHHHATTTTSSSSWGVGGSSN